MVDVTSRELIYFVTKNYCIHFQSILLKYAYFTNTFVYNYIYSHRSICSEDATLIVITIGSTGWPANYFLCIDNKPVTVSFFSACEGQVLELCLLQVHLCVWSAERAGGRWGGQLVCMVLCAVSAPPSHTALQGQVWVCEYLLPKIK